MNKEKQLTVVKKNAGNRNYDSAWKKVIKNLFKDFLEFFFPDIYEAIDFTKEIHFLDKELKEIDPNSSLGDRVADVLVKVHLKDGTQKYICIIIHIEVQGEPQPNFMERMFIYYYRAFDKEKKEKIPVISLALLTDNDPGYRPGEFSVKLFGFELMMKIPIVKTIDYRLRKELIEQLETTSNPMSMVVKAQLISHEIKKADDDKKFEVTKELIRQCYKYGYSKESTHIILNFFDWVIRLPEAYKDRIKTVIKEAEEEFRMEYIATWERDFLEKGMQKGRQEGRQEGMEKGLVNGEKRQAQRTAKMMLGDGFPVDTISKYTGLSIAAINKLKKAPKSH